MRKIHSISVAVVCIILTGCSQSGPNYTIFSQVPPNHLAKIKAAVKHAQIQNVELPTKFPYSVTLANVFNNYEELPPYQLTIFLGDPTHVVDITLLKVAQNGDVSSMTSNGSETKLPDGTKALYENNGAASNLDWVKNGIFYEISSTNNKNKPDLTKNQLIDVASSFK